MQLLVADQGAPLVIPSQTADGPLPRRRQACSAHAGNAARAHWNPRPTSGTAVAAQAPRLPTHRCAR
jgi:hypothetical protein